MDAVLLRYVQIDTAGRGFVARHSFQWFFAALRKVYADQQQSKLPDRKSCLVNLRAAVLWDSNYPLCRGRCLHIHHFTALRC